MTKGQVLVHFTLVESGKALMGTKMCLGECHRVNAGGDDCSTWADDLCSCELTMLLQ